MATDNSKEQGNEVEEIEITEGDKEIQEQKKREIFEKVKEIKTDLKGAVSLKQQKEQKPTASERKLNGMSLNQFINSDIPPQEYLVDKIIPRSGLVYVYGPPGSFKTNWLLYLTLKAVNGENVFEYNVQKPIVVAWIDEENRAIGMHTKLKEITKGMKLTDTKGIKFAIYWSNDFNIISALDLYLLEEQIKKYKFDLIVIDSIAKVYPLNERNESEVRQIYTMVKPIISEYNVTFVLIHHTRKLQQGQTSRGMEDISGSREFSAMADSMIFLQGIGKNKFLLKQTKNRYDECIEPINFEVKGNDDSLEVIYEGTAKEVYAKVSETIMPEILRWMKNNPQPKYTSAEIVEAMKSIGFKRSSILNALKLLVNNKTVKRPKKDTYELIKPIPIKSANKK